MTITPQLIEHEGILVVRDDLFPGGTKAQIPAVAVRRRGRGCLCERRRGWRPDSTRDRCGATRQARHDLRREARATASARIDGKAAWRQDHAGIAGLSQHGSGACPRVQSPSRRQARTVRRRYARSDRGGCSRGAIHGIEPDEVWCASGSGVLARALAKAWPKARRHVVQVGRRLEPNEVAGATIHVYPLPFGREAKSKPPFPSDPHYDAKAWEICRARKGAGKVIMWNVAGPAQ